MVRVARCVDCWFVFVFALYSRRQLLVLRAWGNWSSSSDLGEGEIIYRFRFPASPSAPVFLISCTHALDTKLRTTATASLLLRWESRAARDSFYPLFSRRRRSPLSPIGSFSAPSFSSSLFNQMQADDISGSTHSHHQLLICCSIFMFIWASSRNSQYAGARWICFRHQYGARTIYFFPCSRLISISLLALDICMRRPVN
jgi:hypothetical protein